MAKTKTVRENTTEINIDFLADVVKRNDFVDLDQALNEKIKTEIEKAKGVTESQAKKLIEKWRNKNPLYTKEFDINKLNISIENTQAVYIESHYHYESRRLLTLQEPANNQNLGTTLEEIWDKPAQNEFQETTINWKRGGSGKISNCTTCNASGKVTCSDCSGEGEVAHKCPNCKGKGIIDMPSVTVGKAGKVGAVVTKRTEQCLKCQASGYIKVRCSKCNGKGEVTCSQCSGKGEVFKYELIEAKTSVLSNNLILSPFQKLKDNWITKSKTDFQISYQDPIEGQNVEKLKPLNPTGDGKYLLEKYYVKVISTSRISFKFKGKERELFIIDNEVKAIETTYLLDKKKTSILFGIIAVAIIAISFFSYNLYQNHQDEKIKTLNEISIISTQCVVNESNSNNISEAKKCLEKIDAKSTDLHQETKDSISQAIFTFLSKSIENNDFKQVLFVKSKFYKLDYLPQSTKDLIDDMIIINSISEKYNVINEYVNSTPNNDYETIKKWENILSSEITALNLYNSEFKNPDIQESINKQQFVVLINSHVKEYYKALMNNFLENGSREGEAKTFLSKLQQLKSISKEFDFKNIQIKINKAIEKHKIKWK